MIKLYFSTVQIIPQRPTHISAVATVLLITRTFIVQYYERKRQTQTDRQTEKGTDRQTDRQTERSNTEPELDS